jgi:hypothetical protein
VSTIDEGAGFDAAAAHVHFSKACFNGAWTLIEKADRDAADDEAMVALTHASIWHWSQRSDCTDRHRSIGAWQAARVHALLGHGAEAERHAALADGYARFLAPFYRASAKEALARAALARGDRVAANAHALQAKVLAQGIVDADERDLVLNDLAQLGLGNVPAGDAPGAR